MHKKIRAICGLSWFAVVSDVISSFLNGDNSMKRFLMSGLLLGYLLLGINQAAQAHVSYTDINGLVGIGGYDSLPITAGNKAKAFPMPLLTM